MGTDSPRPRRMVVVTRHAAYRCRQYTGAAVSLRGARAMVEAAIRECVPCDAETREKIRQQCPANGYRRHANGGWVYWYHPASHLAYVTKSLGPAHYLVVTCFPIAP